MLQQLIFGLLLGWGAAIPIGPLNLEIIRRNLRLSVVYGVAFGLGACLADVTYLSLLAAGELTILTHRTVLGVIGIIGSLILFWFGYNALKLGSQRGVRDLQGQQQIKYAPWRHTTEGYALTLLNPYTILFWSSVSTQIAIAAQATKKTALFAGIGVFLAAVSWVIVLNSLVHFTRHRLSERAMYGLNIFGGLLLIGFAIIGLWQGLRGLNLIS